MRAPAPSDAAELRARLDEEAESEEAAPAASVGEVQVEVVRSD